MTSQRRVWNSPLTQAPAEIIAYIFDFAKWGTPTTADVKIYDIENDAFTDVTATHMPAGSPSINGDEVTTPQVINLVAGHRYRLLCEVTIDGNTMSAYCDIGADTI